MILPRWLRTLLPILLLVALTAAISAPVYYLRLREPTTDDYDAHVTFTLRLLKRDLPPTFILGHPVLELILGFLYWAGRGHIDIFSAAAFIQVGAQVAAALVLFYWIGRIPGKYGNVQRLFWSISLTLVAPIMLLWFVDKQFYFGYITLANYHNPTVHLLRPFALLGFIFAARAFRVPHSPVWMVWLSAAITLTGMLIKPNYGIALLPACAVMAAWFLWKRRAFDWRMLVFGQALPILLALAYQAVLIYWIPDAGDAGVILTPFAVEAYWSNYLPIKLLLSIAFPLCVLWMLRHKFAQDDELLLGCLAFAVALVHLYFFAESGDRFTHANFRWGAQTTLFILFAISARRLIALTLEAATQPFATRQRVWPAYAFYMMHLAAGIAYYIFAYVQPNYN